MPAFITSEKTLKYLVDLAEGRVPKDQRTYKVDVSGMDATDETLAAIHLCKAYPVCFLEPVEAEKALILQYYAARDTRREPHPIVESYVMARLGRLARGEPASEVFLRKRRGKSKDRALELETEKLRAEVEVERRKKQRPLTGEDAIQRVADRYGIDRNTLDARLYPRKRNVTKSR